MTDGKGMLAAVCVSAALSCAAGSQPAGGSGSLRGLSIRDLQRVEQLRGDSGGLSRSLMQGPANASNPNDFSGVYQIPDDADTPYAGWYVRASGATIAVFPRGEYTATPDGLMVTLPANTRFFLGTIPLGGGKAGKPTEKGNLVTERVDRRVDDRWRADAAETVRKPMPDAPPPATVETARDLSAVSLAVEKLCSDPVYRANRLRELLERAAQSKPGGGR